VRCPAGVFGGPTCKLPAARVTRRLTVSMPEPRSTSTHCNAQISPRRSPRSAASHHSANNQSSRTLTKNRANCSGVHTATAGRWPLRRHAATRAGDHGWGRCRTGRGNTTSRAGLTSSNRSRTATFSARRSVARMRCSVAAVTGCPSRVRCVAMSANIASRCPTVSPARVCRPEVRDQVILELPGRPAASWRRVDPGVVQDLPYRAGRHLVAQSDQFTLNAAVSP
jgi:hypothetical protein